MNLQTNRAVSSRRWIVATFLCLCFTCATSFAESLQGDWQGVLGGNLPLVFHLAAGGAGTADSPSQKAFGMPLQYTSNAAHVSISIPSVAATYTGSVDGSQMTGTFTQHGQNIPLTLMKGQSSQGGVDSVDVHGNWQGMLGGNLPLVFHLAAGGAGTADSPSQKAFGMPLQYTSNDTNVSISIPSVAATYTGTVTGRQMTGTFTQHGQNIPLTLAKL